MTATGKEKSVAVSGYNHMPIFVNSEAASVNFNLIRVLPGAAGQKSRSATSTPVTPTRVAPCRS